MSAPSAADLQAQAVSQIANVSRELRNAIAASLPVAPEQYLTIAIPGTVLDIRAPEKGGTLVYDPTKEPFVPTAVRQVEARLVDYMVPLASVMLGNTGKSVARSYSRALDSLLPRVATVTGGDSQTRSPGSALYDNAMKYLTSIDANTGMTPIDAYIDKQRIWAAAQDAWDTAKISAQSAAKADPANNGDSAKILQAYNDWNQENYRKFKFAAQGAWMDWVANGHKYDVEFNFGTVDVDSIMARVENSKESMRNSTMVDVDGANELQGVILTPPNWATLCKQKADGWYTRNGGYSLAQLDAEIARLNRLLISYQALEALSTADPPTYPLTTPEEPLATGRADTDLQTAFTNSYKALADVNKLNLQMRNAVDDAAAKAIQDSDGYKTALGALTTAETALSTTVKANTDYKAAYTKYQTASLTGDAKASMTTWLTAQIATINAELVDLGKKRVAKLATNPVTIPVVVSAHAADGGDVGVDVGGPGAELANPIFQTATQTSDDDSTSDPWTSITCSFSATTQSTSSSSSSWGTSFGANAGWGLWSVGGAYSHDQSSSDSVSDLASCDVSVSFSALIVNIARPWLYAELFSDFELEVADGVLLSPGAKNLHTMMDKQGTIDANGSPVPDAENAMAYLAQYNSFPAFPTSFIVAADTTIEFNGNTSHVEDHFSAQSNSGNVSVGWGPFAVSSSFHQSSSQQSHQMQTTATGVRLTFGAPQIIGWVSQILPQLPRDPAYEPMIQNMRPPGQAIAPTN